MNKVLEEKLVSSLDEVQGWVNVTKGFVLEQAPLVVQEVIRWGLYQHIFWASLSFLLLIISLIVAYLSLKIIFNIEDYAPPTPRNVIAVLFSIGSPISSMVWFCNMSYSLYMVTFISVAPRLYVLDQLATLLDKANGS